MSTPALSAPTKTAIHAIARDAAALAAFLALAGFLSVMIGQDANWDLQNYHYYNPWAWMHGQRAYDRDIVAAQLQTYHNPLPDLPFYAMVNAGWDPKLIAVALALPAGIAVFFLWKLARLLFRELPRADRAVAVACAVTIGASSGVGFGVLGTTMNEWPGAALVMASMYVLVRALPATAAQAIPRAALVAAGMLAGLATGGKFTFGVFAVGACSAVLLRGPLRVRHSRNAVAEAATFGVAVLAGTLATAGAWMWSLWTHFRNPIFPYGNIWMKSPWWGQYEVMGRAFGPHTWTEWLVFPFSLASPPPFYVTEMSYVDGRLPAVYALALAAGAAALALRIGGKGRDDALGAPLAPAWRFLAVTAFVSFVVWTAQYSILRYALTLELLAGVFVVGLLVLLVRRAARIPVLVMSALALVGTTSIPDWWRNDFAPQWFSVDVPKLDRNPLVLATSDAPMSYVYPFFPDDASFLGIDNNISDARRRTLMEEAIRKRIREHTGPLYSLSYPVGGGVDALLERGIYKVTETCQPIVTNMRTSPIEICRVVQAAGK